MVEPSRVSLTTSFHFEPAFKRSGWTKSVQFMYFALIVYFRSLGIWTVNEYNLIPLCFCGVIWQSSVPGGCEVENIIITKP